MKPRWGGRGALKDGDCLYRVLQMTRSSDQQEREWAEDLGRWASHVCASIVGLLDLPVPGSSRQSCLQASTGG